MPLNIFQEHLETALSKINGISYEFNDDFQYWFIEMGVSPIHDEWIPLEDDNSKWCQVMLHFNDTQLKSKNTSLPVDIQLHRVIGSEKSYHHILKNLCFYFDELFAYPL
jgi:hypothetical protein